MDTSSSPNKSIIESHEVTLFIEGNEVFHADLDKLAIIAEYSLPATSENWGHYIVLILSDGCYIEWPTEATYSKQAVQTLEAFLKMKLPMSLCSANTLSSRIIWPPNLMGNEAILFKVQTKSIMDKISRIFASPRFSLHWSDAVLAQISIDQPEPGRMQM